MALYSLVRTEGPVPATEGENTAFSCLLKDLDDDSTQWVHVEVLTDELAVPEAVTSALTGLGFTPADWE